MGNKKNKAKPNDVRADEALMSEEELETPRPVEEETASEETLPEESLDGLSVKLAEVEKKAEEFEEKWKSALAEMANYRKITERDRDDNKRRIRSDILEKFLPVVDALDLAQKHKPADLSPEVEQWAEGIELSRRKLDQLLENEGLVKMDVKPGDELDPNRHMAVTSEESDEYGTNQIIEVLQSGYVMGDKVIRTAVVRVAK